MTPTPEPREFRGTKTCNRCGCHWSMFDLSAPNPIEDWCTEPMPKWYPFGCSCHSPVWVMTFLDGLERVAQERAELAKLQEAIHAP